jgi:LCP family protein required for cell wall assembly
MATQRPLSQRGAAPPGTDDKQPDRDEGSLTGTRLRDKTQRRHRLVHAARMSAALIAIALFLATGLTLSTKKWGEDSLRRISALDQNSSAIVDAQLQDGDQNFLLIGTDSRAAADSAPLVVHVPEDRSTIVVVSFPGDLEAESPGCDDAGQATIKISFASEHGGPLCVTKVIQQVSGLRIDHVVGMDFDGFKAMVDAVDGVQLCVDRPIRDAVLGSVVDRPGPVELAGDKALNFVMARHVDGDQGSEEGRIHRQQRFMAALIRKALSDPAKLDALISAVAAKAVVDNVGMGDLEALSRSLVELGAERVTFVAVPTTGEDAAALFRSIIDGSGAGGNEPKTSSTVSVPAEQIKLQVLNGTGKDGLASQITRKLRTVGFEVVKVDNAPKREEQTVVRHSAAREAQAWSVAAAVPGAALQLDPAMGGAVELVLGTGFDGVIKSVEPGELVQGQPPVASAPAGPAPESLQTFNGADTSCV